LPLPLALAITAIRLATERFWRTGREWAAFAVSDTSGPRRAAAQTTAVR
jgi:hypothetical protein